MTSIDLVFQVLSITYVPSLTSVTITVTTNFASHLWMRWSKKEPGKHKKPIYVRGGVLILDVYYCFNVYHDNEQEEAGDTTTHTFIKPNWPWCETRWFYFFGKRGGVDSPSESALFSYHNDYTGPAPPPPCFILTNCSLYGAWAQGREIVWGVIPLATFQTNHLRLWASDWHNRDRIFWLFGRIYEVSDLNVPISPPLAEDDMMVNLPYQPAMMQLDFSFPTITMEAGRHYAFGMLNHYQTYTVWMMRRHTYDQSACYWVKGWDRVQNPDGSYGPWNISNQPPQPCHQFLLV